MTQWRPRRSEVCSPAGCYGAPRRLYVSEFSSGGDYELLLTAADVTEWTERFTDREEEETADREGKGKRTSMVSSIIGVWVWFKENQTERTSDFYFGENRMKWEEEEEVKMEANVFHG